MPVVAAPSPADPSIVRSDVRAMQRRSAVCNALMGGTMAMREAEQSYLPKEPAESAEAYKARLEKTVLFPAFQKAVVMMTGKPFGTPIDLAKDVPQPLVDAAENIDLAGRNLDTFARDIFQQTMTDGIGWVLVDYPRVQAGLTLGDERSLGVRPYFVHVPLSDVLGWRTEIVNGVHKLTQFRFMEREEVPDGDFGVKTIQRVSVWEPGIVRVYTKSEDAGLTSWTLDDANSGPVTMDEVPVVTFYTGRTGFLTATPPLEDLGWLNVEHWQSRSDQRHILHVARVPLLFGKNLGDATNSPIVIGPNRLIRGDNPDSDLKYVEHAGNAIASGRQDLVDIEDAMRRCAGEILSRTPGDKTATESRQEGKEGASQLRKWVTTFADALEEGFRLAAKWIDEPSGGSLTVDTNWDDDDLTAEIMIAMANLNTAGLLSQDSVIWNLKTAGMLPPDRDVQTEKALIKAETPTPPPTPQVSPESSALSKLTARILTSSQQAENLPGGQN